MNSHERFQVFRTTMFHHVALVITDVVEERIASIIRAARIGGLGTTLAACFGY
jgi:uncharacterized membrane protein required for colicin V production